jgi:hypothetical protein
MKETKERKKERERGDSLEGAVLGSWEDGKMGRWEDGKVRRLDGEGAPPTD